MGKTNPEFVIAIGDNFYSKGVKSTSDPQFEQKFEQTFTAPSLNVSWYVASGNHDYYGATFRCKSRRCKNVVPDAYRFALTHLGSV